MNSEKLKIGQKIVLTGIGYIGDLATEHVDEIESMQFPIETEVFFEDGNDEPLCLGNEAWGVAWFKWETI